MALAISDFGLAWLAKPKAIVVIPKFHPLPNHLRKTPRKVQRTACNYAKTKARENKYIFGLNIIIRLCIQHA